MGIMDRIKKATGSEENYAEYDESYYDEFETEDTAADLQQGTADVDTQGMGVLGGMNNGISLSGTSLEIKVVKPQNFNSVSQIADHLLNKRTVIMNLEDTNKETARRLIDFLSGVAYSIDGALKKLGTNAYIITPSNVDVGDAQLRDRQRERQEAQQAKPNPMSAIENEDLGDF